jgi:hypothetical protein
MPWHRIRVCAEHGARRRHRITYWLNVSILATLLAVVLAWLGTLSGFLWELASARPAYSSARILPAFAVSPGACAGITVFGLLWVFVATVLKPGK